MFLNKLELLFYLIRLPWEIFVTIVLNLVALLNLPENPQPLKILMQLVEKGKIIYSVYFSFLSYDPNPQKMYPLWISDLGAWNFSDFLFSSRHSLGIQVKITLCGHLTPELFTQVLINNLSMILLNPSFRGCKMVAHRLEMTQVLFDLYTYWWPKQYILKRGLGERS